MVFLNLHTGGEVLRPKDGCVTVLGFFDGVHRGHRHLIAAAGERARLLSLPLLAFSFRGEGGPKRGQLLQSDEERAAALGDAGADLVCFADFPSLAGLSPREFVADILVGTCGASVAYCGENFRFGRGAAGDAVSLFELMREHGGEAAVAETLFYEGQPISSAAIRKALAAGDCHRAAEMLGAPYTVTLPVVEGEKRGRLLGFPTANQRPLPCRMLPADGVYITRCRIAGGEETIGITDIGTRPTFGGSERRMETHLLDFRGELYGEALAVSFCRFIRKEEKFETREALIERLAADEREARAWKATNGIS